MLPLAVSQSVLWWSDRSFTRHQHSRSRKAPSALQASRSLPARTVSDQQTTGLYPADPMADPMRRFCRFITLSFSLTSLSVFLSLFIGSTVMREQTIFGRRTAYYDQRSRPNHALVPRTSGGRRICSNPLTPPAGLGVRTDWTRGKKWTRQDLLMDCTDEGILLPKGIWYLVFMIIARVLLSRSFLYLNP